MSFVDNAKKIVTDTAENVVKASGELIENSKIKYRLFDANIDIKKLYEKLGKYVYDEYNTDEDFSTEKEDICVQIKELKAYIDELNEKVNR